MSPSTTSSRPSRLRTLALAGTAAAVLVGAGTAITAASSSDAAVTGTIHVAGTGGQGVNIRTAPTTAAARVGWVPEGASPSYDCFTYGQNIGGVPVWFHVTYKGAAGYIASFYDDSHYRSAAELTARYGIAPCGTGAPAAPVAAPAPAPAPAPSTAQRAITWAMARNGQRVYDGWCLSFVHDAYLYGAGVQIGGAPSAVAYWNAHPAQQHRGDTNPPAGALVFWGPNRWTADGHVALSLGGGQVVSSAAQGIHTVHTFTVASRNAAGYGPTYLGWIQP